MTVGVIGAGTMGSGIAQVAAQAGHEVWLFDTRKESVEKAIAALRKVFDRLVEKGKLTREQADALLARIHPAGDLKDLANCGLVIEAIVEDLTVKKKVFSELEGLVAPDAVLATNTSSLPVTAIAGACSRPERVIGLHFFNPAPLLPLVEVVPGLATDPELAEQSVDRMRTWGKVPVVARDTPGFIVNRVARPFYGEALRIHEEGLADMATIDHAMRSAGGFKMGPFELMDLIGNDVNFTVTRTVFEAFFYDPRYRPSLTQQRMVEAGRTGRKSGRGYYRYDTEERPAPKDDPELLEKIWWRITVMLINEAADALYLRIASRDDLELAMTKGVNYPKGLLAWADALGIAHCLRSLELLQEEYGEDRYRPSPLLRNMVRDGRKFF
ncbi:MAG: NAD(P)-binding domain-containing protein [Flavobacteriales bacterium]|nr:NAD(P)-binding domain-containing protein [Flavobacteriales bacterium]